MTKTSVSKLQNLFLTWISNVGSTRYARIKDVCSYLAERYELDLPYSQYKIFYPLFQSGVVDFCGNGHYAKSPDFNITNGIITLTNRQTRNSIETGLTGLYLIRDNLGEKTFKANQVLEKIPSVDKIVEHFPIGQLDLSLVKKKNGIIVEPKRNYIRYFYNDESNLLVKIPPMEENPDALNVAFTYESIINGRFTCSYDTEGKELKFYRYGIPIVIYRVLLIESLLSGNSIEENNRFITFKGIKKSTIKQINRILLNTLKYE